ncbi:MAG: DAK2 domain-containing protein, partial [Clostridia bacterium]|nr:DAK2 domain-containing protein [Clostridia bacterium]
TEKRVIVLATKTIPQGISCMFAFDESLSPEENEAAMTEAASMVKSFSLTYAVHDSTADGMDIHTGQSLGLLNGKVRFYADTDTECLSQMIEEMTEGSVVTIFYGEDVTEEDAKKVAAQFEEALPMADVTLLPGNQPVYKYIISCE